MTWPRSCSKLSGNAEIYDPTARARSSSLTGAWGEQRAPEMHEEEAGPRGRLLPVTKEGTSSSEKSFAARTGPEVCPGC